MSSVKAILEKAEKIYFTAAGCKYIYIGNARNDLIVQAEKDAQREMRKGHAVTWADGRKEWINLEAEWVDGDYVWHKDGNRVRIQCLHSVIIDGEITVTELRKTWRNYDLI